MRSQGSVAFNQKLSEIDKFLKRTFETRDNERDNVPRASNVVKKQKLVKMQYRKEYIQNGFSWCGNKDAPKPLCVIFGEQRANEAMVPNKHIHHLNKKHAVYTNTKKIISSAC